MELYTEENIRTKLENDIVYFKLYDKYMEIYFKYRDEIDNNESKEQDRFHPTLSDITCSYSDIGCDNLTIFHD